jgi:hypothetical protein
MKNGTALECRLGDTQQQIHDAQNSNGISGLMGIAFLVVRSVLYMRISGMSLKCRNT